MQIDYLLLAIILFPVIAGSLLAYVARKNRDGGAVQLSGEELQNSVDNIYDYRYQFRDINSSHD